jgi:hypothetical protein
VQAWKKGATAEHAISALQTGFRAFDTANQPRHYNETSLGHALSFALREMNLSRYIFSPVPSAMHAGQFAVPFIEYRAWYE